jgi:hypothetical protein
LAQQLEYLRAENAILRARLPKRITVTPHERNGLLRCGAPLGRAINGLITIVTPRTFARWLQKEKKTERKRNPKEPGGKPTAPDVEVLVLKLTRENDWGVYKNTMGTPQAGREEDLPHDGAERPARTRVEPRPNAPEALDGEVVAAPAARLARSVEEFDGEGPAGVGSAGRGASGDGPAVEAGWATGGRRHLSSMARGRLVAAIVYFKPEFCGSWYFTGIGTCRGTDLTLPSDEYQDCGSAMIPTCTSPGTTSVRVKVPSERIGVVANSPPLLTTRRMPERKGSPLYVTVPAIVTFLPLFEQPTTHAASRPRASKREKTFIGM